MLEKDRINEYLTFALEIIVMNLLTLVEDTHLDTSLQAIGRQVLNGERITFDEGVQLFE